VAEFINRCFPGPFTGGTGVTLATDLKKNQSRRPGAKDKPSGFRARAIRAKTALKS